MFSRRVAKLHLQVTLEDLNEWLVELTEAHKATLDDGTATQLNAFSIMSARGRPAELMMGVKGSATEGTSRR